MREDGVPVWNIEGTALGRKFKEHLAKSEGNSQESEGNFSEQAEQIRQQAALRELDVAVARIIGRQLRWIPKAGEDDLGEFTRDREWFDNGWLDVEENMPVAKYSTSADAALSAYEVMRGRGWWMANSIHGELVKDSSQTAWLVKLEYHMRGWVTKSISSKGATFAEALCKAIVAAHQLEER